MERKELDRVGGVIVAAAIRVHRKFGAGLRETFYESVLARELIRSGVSVERQRSIPYSFEGETFIPGLRLDLFVEESIVIELKSRSKITEMDVRQLLTYLKLLNVRLGYLLNFGAPLMKQGIRRVANKL